MERLRIIEIELSDIQSKPAGKIDVACLEIKMAEYSQAYTQVTRALASMTPKQFREYHTCIQEKIGYWRRMVSDAEEREKQLEARIQSFVRQAEMDSFIANYHND